MRDDSPAAPRRRLKRTAGPGAGRRLALLPPEPRDSLSDGLEGSHLCSLFDGTVQYRTVIRRFLARARKERLRVLWIRGEPSPGSVEEILGTDRFGRGAEGVRVLEPEESFLVDGAFDPRALVDLYARETRDALAQGYDGLLGIQDMCWALDAPGDPPLEHYEATLSTFLPGSPCGVLCLYDKRRFTPEALLGTLETHPRILLGSETCENIYAMPPEDLLYLDAPSATLERRLKKLREHRMAERTRRRHTDLMGLLHSVALSRDRGSTVPEVLRIALEEVSTFLGWPVGHAWAPSDTGDRLFSTGVWSLDDPDRFSTLRTVTEATPMLSGEGLPGMAYRRGRPIWIPDVMESDDFARPTLGGGIGVRAALAVPVRLDSRVMAVLEFFSEFPRSPDADVLEVMGHVGEHLGQVLERKEADEELRLLESAVRQVQEAVVVTDARMEGDGPRIIWVNPAFTKITGYEEEEAVGQPLGIIMGPRTDRKVRERAKRSLEAGEAATGEVIGYRKNGDEFVLEWHVAPVREPDGGVTRLVSIQRDVTEQRRAEEAVRRADHDSLTGLPNRDLFLKRLERAMEAVRIHPGRRLAVLFMDLDRFKMVNDSLGHLVGDELLVAVARRLERSVRPGDLVARFGGDEFTVLLEDVDDTEEAVTVARRIQEQLSPPVRLRGEEVVPTASIGITLAEGEHVLPEDVLRDADTAMYDAKARGPGRHSVFKEELRDDARTTFRMENELRRALDRNEFRVAYQPIVSLSDGRTLGFEALLRWQHPERGLLGPTSFVPLAEETGLIGSIDQWVLGESSRQVRRWNEHRNGAGPLTLSVNLSAREFTDGELVSAVRQTLRDTGMDPRRLQLEITESVLIDRPHSVHEVLEELRKLGIRLCLDDFGTGYSSLSYLHRFPVEVLKIDRLFVERMENGNGARDVEIVRAILSMARSLEMDVTAEGVETEPQLRRLKSMRCPTGQGFLFSRPVSAEEAGALVTG